MEFSGLCLLAYKKRLSIKFDSMIFKLYFKSLFANADSLSICTRFADNFPLGSY